MKKLMLISMLVALMVTPALANPSLGTWQEGAARSVHVLWTFDSGVILGSPIVGYGYTADPAVYESEGNPGSGTATAFVGGNYVTGGFIGQRIDVLIELSNFPGGPAKTIWVDLDYTGTLTDMRVQGKVAGHTYIGTPLDPANSNGADFGFYIVPNPDKEDIGFSIFAPTGGVVELSRLHIDTICQIPAPGAILLGSIGISIVGWMRRRRTL
jgi:hypothetical protein